MENNQSMILACIDGSGISEAVCDYAAWVAQRTQQTLKLLHTIEHPDTSDIADLSGAIGLGSQEHLLEELTALEQQRSKLLLKKGNLMLDAAKQRVTQAGVEDVITNQRHGSLTESLIDLENRIELLVLGVRGKKHENRSDQLGHQLESVIRSLHRPILVINGPFIKPERIMLAYDGGKAADKAVEMVATSPLFNGLTCHLVCVNKNENSAQELLAAASKKISQKGDINLISKKLSGKVDHALCEYQENHDIDMTVMGAYSHSRLHDVVLGSFTAKMLINSYKPLLLVR